MTPAIHMLKKAKIPYRLHEYEHEASNTAYGMEAAAKLGVPERTFTRWKSDHAELREALTRGKEEPNEKVISALYKEALGYMQEEYVQTRDSAGTVVSSSLSKRWMRPSTGAMAFWLKNRDSQNWRDKWELTHTVDEPLEKFAAAMKEFRFGNDSGQGE